MEITKTIVVFVILWWMLFFIVLPWKMDPPIKVIPGTDPGAPAEPRLLLKTLVTTVMAIPLTALTLYMIKNWLEN